MFTASFNKAVWRLHATIFSSYYDWSEHQGFQPFPQAEMDKYWGKIVLGAGNSSVPALLDLCLYFCLWTEAANVKHMPEAMWFLFWCVLPLVMALHHERVPLMVPSARMHYTAAPMMHTLADGTVLTRTLQTYARVS